MNYLRFIAEVSNNNRSQTCGSYSCSQCLASIDCTWCSSHSICTSNDDDTCSSESLTLTCDTNNYFLIVVVVISVLSMMSLCFLLWYWRCSGDTHHEHTGINSRPTRDEVWHKDDTKPDWTCIICGGDNKPNSTSCSLCGTSRDYTLEYKQQRRLWIEELVSSTTIDPAANDEESQLRSKSKISLKQVADAALGITMEERLKAFNYRRINNLTLRQKSARKRKLWQRVLDKQSGRIEWVRVPIGKVTIGDGPLGYRSQESFFKPLLDPLAENDDNLAWKDTLTEKLLAAHSVRSTSRLEGSALMSASPAYVHAMDAEGRLGWWAVDEQQLATPPGSEAMRAHEDLIKIASLPFNDKQHWFVTKMAKLQMPPAQGLISIDVERSRVLEMSFVALMNADQEDLHKYFRISFRGEAGLDAGGLSREWYALVIKGLFDPALGLFSSPSAGGSESLGGYHINPLSGAVLTNHLSYFTFAGRMIGKAILEQQSIPASLSLPIRKQILGLPVSLSDLEFVDVEFYKSLLWLKTCSTEEVRGLDLDFTVSYESRRGAGSEHSTVVQQNLVPEGASKPVTAENRQEYLMLMLKHRILDSVAPQLTAFLHGLNEVVPLVLLQVFDYQELDLLICGVPTISVDDWKEYTEYLGAYRMQGPNHKVIKWFWECVSEFDNEERARLLQFVTGCSRLPALGFRALQSSDGYYRLFNIQSIEKADSIMPRAHTCFSKLDLPIYSSKNEMQIYLSLVINLEISGGFSLE